MKRAGVLCCLITLTCLGFTCSVSIAAERRTALVIGNAAYGEVGVLRNPVNDATDIAAALRPVGFEVTLVRDANLRTMQEAIETFLHQLRQGGAGLFYFAGHGMQVNGENYLIPLGARVNREQDIPYEAVPVGRLLGGMEDANNQLNIIILDACRDNPFARQWRSAQRGLAVMQAARGSFIAYATAPGSVASDGSGRNGLYTENLLQHLATPGLSVEHLFKKTRGGVVEATKGKQTPWESSSLVGDFFFVPSGAASAPAPSRPTPAPPAAPASSTAALATPEARPPAPAPSPLDARLTGVWRTTLTNAFGTWTLTFRPQSTGTYRTTTSGPFPVPDDTGTIHAQNGVWSLHKANGETDGGGLSVPGCQHRRVSRQGRHPDLEADREGQIIPARHCFSQTQVRGTPA